MNSQQGKLFYLLTVSLNGVFLLGENNSKVRSICKIPNTKENASTYIYVEEE
jgi:hypothetical protein